MRPNGKFKLYSNWWHLFIIIIIIILNTILAIDNFCFPLFFPIYLGVQFSKSQCKNTGSRFLVKKNCYYGRVGLGKRGEFAIEPCSPQTSEGLYSKINSFQPEQIQQEEVVLLFGSTPWILSTS